MYVFFFSFQTQAELFRNAGGDVKVEIICNGLLALQGKWNLFYQAQYITLQIHKVIFSLLTLKKINFRG